MFHDLTVFDLYVIFVGLVAWPYSLVLGCVLLALAIWKAKRWIVRAVLVVSALVLLFPVGVVATFAVPDWVHSYRIQRNYQQHAWTLEASRRIGGFVVPAGSVVHLDGDFDMTHKHSATMADVQRIDLSAPTHLFGAQVKGEAVRRGAYWRVQLVGKQFIDGWPCVGRAGVTIRGKVVKCRLTDTKAAFGYVFPARTRVDLSGKYRFEFWMPEQKTMLEIDPETKRLSGGWAAGQFVLSKWQVPPKINRMAVDFKAHEWTLEHDTTISGAMIPAGSTLEILAAFDMRRKSSLTLRQVSVIHLSAPTVIHGARLRGTAIHFSDYWKGTLSAPQSVDGWPCEGTIRITAKGKVRQCTLSRAHVVHGYRLPARMVLHAQPPSTVMRFEFPDQGYLYFDSRTGELSGGETRNGAYFDAGQIPPGIAAMRVDGVKP